MAQKKKTGPEGTPEAAETQLQIFDRAMKLFRDRRYQEAKQLFELASQGTLREVSHNARLHMNMCDRRIGTPDQQLNTLEEFYNVGVERLNARDLTKARDYLSRAVEISRTDGDRADHVYYALAACYALGGDPRGAYENLKRAIDIDPRNRNAARQDADFGGAAQQAALQALLFPDKSSPF